VTRVLIAADAVGGVWQYSLELAGGLQRLGFEPLIALLGPAPSEVQRTEARGLRLIETGLPPEWLAPDPDTARRTAAALAQLARRERADLFHAAGGACLAGVRPDLAVVAVQHSCVASWWQAVRGGRLPADFAWRTALVREGLAAADAVVAPSRAFADTVEALYDCPVRAIHNGRTQRPLCPMAPDDSIFTAGRLWDEGKDLATLDAAAGRLAVPVHAAGPLEAPHGGRIALANIHWLGRLGAEEMRARFARRPVFVSTARYEPFGLAVLEAAAAGCPLILSDIPTFRELWDDAALFVPPGDAAGFAAAIEGLVGDDLRRAILGRRARRRAGRYSAERMAAATAGLYRSLLGDAPAAGAGRSLGMAGVA